MSFKIHETYDVSALPSIIFKDTQQIFTHSAVKSLFAAQDFLQPVGATGYTIVLPGWQGMQRFLLLEVNQHWITPYKSILLLILWALSEGTSNLSKPRYH